MELTDDKAPLFVALYQGLRQHNYVQPGIYWIGKENLPICNYYPNHSPVYHDFRIRPMCAYSETVYNRDQVAKFYPKTTGAIEYMKFVKILNEVYEEGPFCMSLTHTDIIIITKTKRLLIPKNIGYRINIINKAKTFLKAYPDSICLDSENCLIHQYVSKKRIYNTMVHVYQSALFRFVSLMITLGYPIKHLYLNLDNSNLPKPIHEITNWPFNNKSSRSRRIADYFSLYEYEKKTVKEIGLLLNQEQKNGGILQTRVCVIVNTQDDLDDLADLDAEYYFFDSEREAVMIVALTGDFASEVNRQLLGGNMPIIPITVS